MGVYAVLTDTTEYIAAATSVSNASQGPNHKDGLLPANLDHLRFILSNAGNAGPTTFISTVDVYCGGSAPNNTVQPCCPPDPNLTGAVAQLLELVTLIQRQAAPFAYVYGTNHTALTGTGSIDVNDLLGVSVDVTTLPASYGRAAGTPEEIFEIGFVTLGTVDGWTSSRRIDHDGSLWLPPQAGAFTKIGYTLAPGVAVSIRELNREP